MEKSLDSVRRNFNTVRTGRANVSILDRIQACLTHAARMQPLQRLASPGRCAAALPAAGASACDLR